MGGKGSSGGGGGSWGFAPAPGNPYRSGGGGGGGGADYSGGRKNIGAWNPGGGKVSSYNKSGAVRPDGTSIGSDNRTGNEKAPSFSEMKRGGIPNLPGKSGLSRTAGTALGTLFGGFMLGAPGAGYGGYKGYQSGKEGMIGDLFDARTGENYRDYLERQGVSRKDTALAAKHGSLERSARSAGYSGSENVSLLDEGTDYDSVTGEIF